MFLNFLYRDIYLVEKQDLSSVFQESGEKCVYIVQLYSDIDKPRVYGKGLVVGSKIN